MKVMSAIVPSDNEYLGTRYRDRGLVPKDHK